MYLNDTCVDSILSCERRDMIAGVSQSSCFRHRSSCWRELWIVDQEYEGEGGRKGRWRGERWNRGISKEERGNLCATARKPSGARGRDDYKVFQRSFTFLVDMLWAIVDKSLWFNEIKIIEVAPARWQQFSNQNQTRGILHIFTDFTIGSFKGKGEREAWKSYDAGGKSSIFNNYGKELKTKHVRRHNLKQKQSWQKIFSGARWETQIAAASQVFCSQLQGNNQEKNIIFKS